jgi:hypothetical protein
MATRTFEVEIGDQVFVGDGAEEVGAVKTIAHDHVMIYIENAGEFRLDGPEIISAHDGKLVLDPSKLAPAMADAIAKAHEHEKD